MPLIPSLEEVKVADEREAELATFNPAPAISSYIKAPELDAKRKRHAGRSIGFAELDFLIGGVSSGELIVITAKTGTGKTTLGQSVTKFLAKVGIPTLWYSLEVSIENFIVPLVNNDDGAVHDSVGKLVKVSNLPIYWPDNVERLDFEGLKRTIRYANLKYGVEHVFIDHINYLFPDMGSESNNSLAIGDKLRALRKIALETGVSIFLMVHLKKIASDVEPTMDDIRDSGMIACEADAVILLTRDRLKEPKEVITPDGHKYNETFSPIVKCKVEKSRRTGRRGMVELIWEKGLYKVPDANCLAMIKDLNPSAVAAGPKKYVGN